VAGDSSEAGAR